MEYIIFDLEATCWEEKKERANEIIEIGAVRLSGKLEMLDTFSAFVRPTIFPILSQFCQELTGINQENVDRAGIFEEEMKNFEKWILASGGEAKIISWGYYDKKQIMAESAAKNYAGEITELLEKNHLSLKHELARLRKERTCGMKRALAKLNLPLEGAHHRALSDAKNIAKIFKVVFPELETKGILRRSRNLTKDHKTRGTHVFA